MPADRAMNIMVNRQKMGRDWRCMVSLNDLALDGGRIRLQIGLSGFDGGPHGCS